MRGSGGEAVFVREAHIADAVGRAPKSKVRFCLHCLTLYTLRKSFELAKPQYAHISNGEYRSAYLEN